MRGEPILKYPFSPILHQLTEILSQEGILALMDAWRYRTDRHPVVLSDMIDGRVWKTLKAYDGTLFLDTSPDRVSKDELRIGLIFSMDGYVCQVLAVSF